MLSEKYNIPEININDYYYHLPEELIAEFPEEKRGDSKLLLFDINNDSINHTTFFNIDEFIPNNSLIVFNSTKVISARLIMYKSTGGKVELLCISPIEPSLDPQITMQCKSKVIWEVIIGGRNVKENMILKSDKSKLCAKILKRYDNKAIVEFIWDYSNSFAEIIDEIGIIPLPPYIKRDSNETDKFRYQTVFAKYDGSVAAPTAGLHFTEEIINKIKRKKTEFREVILHVGPGTFVPIKSNIQNHEMHKERIFVTLDIIKKIISHIKAEKDIIATGTTSVRTLESLYWIGLKLNEFNSLNNEGLLVDQWDAYYNYKKKLNPLDSLTQLQKYMEENNAEILSGETRLFIIPGYKFKIVNGLITNYHLPKSTLILLVAAFAGRENWKKIYNAALSNDYKFLSYGDSSFLLNKLNKTK